MKYLYTLLLPFFFMSCIPLSIAPNIDGGKIYPPKKFKKHLPQNYVYVFEDPKNANEFFNYINAKFQVVYDDDLGNIPIEIENNTFYLTFYEVERSTQTVNLVPIVVDAKLDQEGHGPILEDAHITRSGSWYIALTVTNEGLKDALKPSYPQHNKVKTYVDALRQEYLTTVEYIEVYLKSKTSK
ncbi:hypothetical protein [Marixanthomonas spongiae]|uniref:Lipoprotein n=1 Tax=Marixanthomonas spongiae TaxID=2174845 RepID=A0A2U0I8G0_9FLAO|nr:hypothetical protein [Marixanthomonas spongiae]PVW17393.1 hypothetical protein DDV96_02495 [Marixanthomonas spongiae]